MGTRRYVALLRGINVGGKNLVAMAALRTAFEDAGLADVTTYIQSGNVMFTTDAPAASLEGRVERLLEEWLGYPLVVVVRSHAQLRAVVRDAPEGFGESPDTYYCDALFLRKPLTPAATMRVVQQREGVDRAWPGKGVVYFERLGAQRTRSKLSAVVGTPEYRLMTIRSWATTTKLLALLDAAR